MLVAVEGIDGSGKGTQARRLCDRLVESGRTAQLVSFPRYTETLFGKAVGDFLNGRFGALEDVSPFLVSLLYAGDRLESREMLQKACDDNDVVVVDRYVASNVAHQGAKLDPDERPEFIEWIDRVEHEIYRLPRPDLVLLLDLPVETAQRLITRKRTRDYTDKPADIQEADAEYLARVRDLYLELAAQRSNWRRIDSVGQQGLRTIDDVAEKVWDVVRERLT